MRNDIKALIEGGEHRKAFDKLLELVSEVPSARNYHFVSKHIDDLDTEYLDLKGIRIAILSSFTIEPVTLYLKVKCYQAGLNPKIYIGGYNQWQQEILDRVSQLYKFDPEVLILAIRTAEIFPLICNSFLSLSDKEIESEIDGGIQAIRSLLAKFRVHSQATILFHNFETPLIPDYGILDNRRNLGQISSIHRANQRLQEICHEVSGLYILDYEHLVTVYGKLNWQDERMWLHARMPIAGENLPHLAEEYLKYLRPMRGLNRKCLVLDLDNTLWGGIAGDDGLDGIKIGHDYPGNAFLNFQEEILKLYEKGIILAINSKNDEKVIIEILERHPNMILRDKHFAVKKINWGDKTQNMREIAAELNIGLDSLVFVDDSPFERELVKAQLPEVLVVDMPEDPSYYARIIATLPYFETLSFSEEDRNRTEMYRRQVERKKLEESSVSLEDFYRKSHMRATIKYVDSHSIPRVAQLTQRTNQFNLTTRRYTDAEILSFSQSPSNDVFYLRLEDTFGDNGIVAVCIITKLMEDWYIDTFLMSCRVIGRTLETAFLNFIIDKTQKEGAIHLRGKYAPTSKNMLVENFYKEHGFRFVGKDGGTSEWELDIGKAKVTFLDWVEILTT